MRRKLVQIKRLRLIMRVFTVIMIILIIRMSDLTIAKGDHYREVSENLSIKDVYVSAPRGEIRDRNGISLASNKPTFVLQIIKEEFAEMEDLEKNHVMSKAIKVLERDGIFYNDSFALNMNTYVFKNTSDYLSSEDSPKDIIIDTIIEENILKDILSVYYEEDSMGSTYYYFPIENVLNSLSSSAIEAPFIYTYQSGRVRLDFDQSKNIDAWKQDHYIGQDLGPVDSLLAIIDNDETIIRKLLDHPVPRKIAFDLIEDRNLNNQVDLLDLSNDHLEEYKSIKRSFMKVYPEINMDTSAKQDFITIFEQNTLSNFLSANHENQEVSTKESLELLYEDSDFLQDYEIIENSNKLTYRSSDGSELSPEEISIILIEDGMTEALIDLGNNSQIAQDLMVADGINTRISVVRGFEYQPMRQYKAFNEKFSISSDMDQEEALNKIKSYYNIAENISRYELIGICNIYEDLSKKSELAYMPVNFSYNLKDSTVALLTENLHDYDCFNISVEPIRYYPNGNNAAHVLGYMGKISQEGEIKRFVDDQGYSPDTIIGKTGIEESCQDFLYGKDGRKKIEVDPFGNSSDVLEEVEPIPGDNVYLTLDYKLQRRAELALDATLKTIREGGTIYSPWGDFETVKTSSGRPYDAARSGAVVVTDVKTGEVLAMASYPAYDPNLFSTGISAADWESLMPENEDNPLAPRPLYNVASQTAIQPGSTFKMITALAGLEKGLDPDNTISCEGYIVLGDTEFGCWIHNLHEGAKHGPMTLTDAIRDSCNYYFYTLALGYNQRTGANLGFKVTIDDINDMAEKFGLGQETGIEINTPAETQAPRPNPESKLAVQKALLGRWLDANIETYYIGDEDLSPNRINQIKEEIVSLMDREDLPSLSEVYNILADLDLDGSRQVNQRGDTLADLIKFTYIDSSRWTTADTVNITIGQGENQQTLLQTTNYVASIANGGFHNDLTLISNIKDYSNSTTKFEKSHNPEKIDLKSQEGLKAIQKGMRQASITGLNQAVFEDFPIPVALKTGTAERSGINPDTNREYDSFAYELAYAPYDNPEIAIGVVLFEGGSGANCSPIVREIVAEYMGLYSDQTKDSLPIDLEVIP